jgi:hypothetical protein
MGNYSFKTTGLPEPVNGVVESHNLLQGKPHTKIYNGVSGLTFRKCNLTNCDLPVDAVVDDCLIGHVSFCSHLHEKWAEKGLIDQCSENCEHISEIDTVTIDGVVVDTVYQYADKVVI